MDGNGRWANQRGLPRRDGHRAGAESVQECVDVCLETGISWLTLYAFSTENWDRPKLEVEALMLLLHEFLRQKTKTMLKEGVRLHTIGDTARLPARTRALLAKTMEQTAQCTKLNVVLALSYGSRDEIVKAVQAIASQAQAGTLDPSKITAQMIGEHLDTAGMPDPDLLIRTSGEYRISNFLLWQISYSELYITPCLWPDFNKAEFSKALEEYANRDRRFGK